MQSAAEDAAEVRRRKWRRRRDAVLLLLLLLVLVSTQARHLTRVGRSGLIAGTSTTVGSSAGEPEPDEDDPEGGEGSDDELPELPDAPEADEIAGQATAPAASDGAKVLAPADPLATTRRRQRQRLAGRPGGPVGPPDAPENNTEDPPVDTGLERSASAKPAPR